MKKLLAYIFFSISICTFLLIPTFSFAAGYGETEINSQNPYISYKKSGDWFYSTASVNPEVVSKVLADGKPGIYDTKTGQLIKNQNVGTLGGGGTYIETDGHIAYIKKTGPSGIVDATADDVVSAGNEKDDVLVGAVYKMKNQDGSEKLVGISAYNQDTGQLTGNNEFKFDVSKRFGFQGAATNADEYNKAFNAEISGTSFGTTKTIADVVSDAKNDRKTNESTSAEIDNLQSQLDALRKDPNADPEEIAYLEGQISDKQASIDETKQNNKIAQAASKSTAAAIPREPTMSGEYDLQACVPNFHLVAPTEFNPVACMAGLSNMAVGVAAIPFAWSSRLLDFVTDFTVSDFGTYFAKGGKLYDPVNNIWQLFKNICNIFFITALVYIAIKTILNASGFQEQQRLKNVIIFAVLINFSMFFTKVMIDVSNTASLQVFNVLIQSAEKQTKLSDTQLAGNAALANARQGAVIADQHSLAAVFISNMGIQKFVANGIGGSSIVGLTTSYIAIYGLFTVIFIVVATIVIAVIAGMMLMRFLTLVLLLMTSPIAYVGTFVPAAIGNYSQMWWKKIVDNMVFLPVLMLMFYITMQFTQFASGLVQTKPNDWITLIFGYIMTIAMLLISLSVAKSAGGSAGAADFGSKWAKSAIGGMTFGLAARAGRRAAGGAGYLANKSGLSSLTKRVANSNSLLFRATGAGALARQALKGGEKLQNATFDARNTGAGKNLGLGEGLKDGYKKGIVEANEKLAKEKIEYAKKQAEKSDKQKADEEIYNQYKRAQDNLAANKKSEDEYNKTIKENTNKLANVKTDIDAEIKKEKDEIEKQLLENEKELREIEKVLKDTTAAPEAIKAAESEKKSREERRKNLDERNRKTSDSAERDRRIAEKEDKIRNEISTATKLLKAVNDAKDQVEKDAKDAEEVVRNFGYKPDELKKQVEDVDKVIKQKKKEYIAHLESNARKTFGSNNLSFVPSEQTDAYRAKLAEELKNLYKSSEDKELKKALDLIRKQAKEDEKKEEDKKDGK